MILVRFQAPNFTVAGRLGLNKFSLIQLFFVQFGAACLFLAHEKPLQLRGTPANYWHA
jgi:hypothetical protein